VLTLHFRYEEQMDGLLLHSQQRHLQNPLYKLGLCPAETWLSWHWFKMVHPSIVGFREHDLTNFHNTGLLNR